MTTTTPPKGRRHVPAVEPSAPSTSAVDALATQAAADIRPVPIADLRPHPHNPRRDLGDLTELTDSIRAHGVRQNLLVVPSPDTATGGYRIVIGHRRHAAAAAAGLSHVPAVVDATLTDADQLELMLVENLQRIDLSPVEEADGYQGLLDLGIGARQIAKRTGRSEKTITARLRLLTLPEPAREKVHTHQATLEDALALANFDGPDDLREALVEQLGESGFAHHVERARRTAAEREALADLRAQLEGAGVTIVATEAWADVTDLWDLCATEPTESRIPPSLTVEEHSECPGHVARIFVSWEGPRAQYGCTDPVANGHYNRMGGGRSSGSAQTTEERREVIANNKAAAAAETVRRQWIRDLLKRAKLPDDAAVYVARIIRPGVSADYREKNTLDDLLYGKPVTDRDRDQDRSTPAGALRQLVALAVARVESGMGKDFWRLTVDDHRIHLEQLAEWGYELADVEQAYLKKARKRVR